MYSREGLLEKGGMKGRGHEDGVHTRRVVTSIVGAGVLLLVYWWNFSTSLSVLDSLSRSTPLVPGVVASSEQFYHAEYPQLEYTSPPPPPQTSKVEEHQRNPAYLVKAYRGAVATENEVCSKMGVDVLKRGGNAVDAAISATFCTGVLNMFSSGIGGGGFMVVRLPPAAQSTYVGEGGNKSEVWTLNFRETAPAASNSTMFKDDPMKARWGGLAVGIPGELRGLQEAHRRWGSVSWKDLVEPSARLAAGWRVHPELERRIQMHAQWILNSSDWRSIFTPDGVLLKEGDWIYRTNYSRTLYTIAEQGPEAFYEGAIADAVVEKVRQTGGILTHKDLKDYRIRVEEPLVGSYRGRKIYTTHAPGGGTLLLQMFNVLENYDMSERTPLAAHRIVETMKFAFASRTRMCDPQTRADITRISSLVSKDYAKDIVRNITDDRTHPPEYYNAEFDIPIDQGTSHTSVIDQNGMAVALTSTVNSVFGSRVLDPITGIIFNNEMDDFAVPGVPNDFGIYPSPCKSLYATIGGSGGGRIFTSVVQTLLNLDWGLHASEAVEFGRVHDQLYPFKVDVDEIYPSDAIEYLRQAGHNVSGMFFFGPQDVKINTNLDFTVANINRIAAVVQLVMRKDGILYAASDSRKNGVAAGY
ncbi:hypothetical protein NP233_g3319 [Leucocoprinus birnbaumii]|uniref:Glutathione hydrolase n=1 Tax=Leucocoprinus birnbaumii TaxID=56174 RepID=A0AAD5YU15_9AGAR|nr:hypothetical protein NP233_g3319 [Leucocoprinus birnbaumii]